MKSDLKPHNFNIVVTIDGPCASGKSTIAKLLAHQLGFEHLDTGAIYRVIALWCFRHGWKESDASLFIPRLSEIQYECEVTDGFKVHKLNRVIVNDQIRTPEISQLASKLAAIQEVRDLATTIQRRLAKGKNVVVEGRDAGTVVFPRAPVKIFLVASKLERARRRLLELQKKFPEKEGCLSLEMMTKELEERDERDRNRELSPMIKPIDAVTVDTTGLSIHKVLKKIVKFVKLRSPKPPGEIWIKLVGLRRARTNFLYKFTLLLTLVIYKLFYRLKVYGLENYPAEGDVATIVAPNHISFLDPPAVGVACPSELHAMGIDYLFKIPIIKSILPRINVHPVSSQVTDAGVIRTVVSLLKEGKNVMIFPEGGRSDNNELLPFKRGVGVLAALTGCSITPTYVDGPYKIWKKGNIFPKPWGKVSVIFGKPIYWRDYEGKYASRREAEKAIMNDVRDQIQKMKDTFKR